MKIILLAFVAVFLSASTFAQTNHDLEPTDTTDDSTTVTSTTVTPTVTPDQSTTSSSLAPTTTSPSTSAQTTTSSSTLVPTTTPSPTSETTSTPSPTPAPTTTSTPVPETTTSTPVPKTTTSTPVPKTTTSPVPETTTSHETTSVAPTSSPEPVTTKAPIPVPEPGYWNVTEGNTTCIRANLAIRFKIEINDQIDYFVLDPTASSEGSKCNTSDGTEVLTLTDNNYIIIFIFDKHADNVYVRNISLTYILPFSTETFYNDSHFFEVKAGSSYLCKTASNVILGNATMEIISVHIQAFGAEHNKDFASAEECGADSPINDIVPIAVGVALLSLVVVVLIAYLVGRRRNRQKGYQSV